MTNEPISPVSDEYEDTGNAIFYRYAPFIQDFIYQNHWAALRGVQLAAAKTLFDTDHNLLITSSTASGKTEAAFSAEQRVCGKLLAAAGTEFFLFSARFGRIHLTRGIVVHRYTPFRNTLLL